MSTEVFNIIRRLGKDNIELQIATQCAPVISGLKISNLLITALTNETFIINLFKNSDIDVLKLASSKDKVFFLVYRKDPLKEYLSSNDVNKLLIEYGYESDELSYVLHEFSLRYNFCLNNFTPFPHELGLILGYPVEDVIKFVKYKGKNYLHVGYWKVYEDPKTKLELFEKFDSATEAFSKLVGRGVSINHIVKSYYAHGSN